MKVLATPHHPVPAQPAVALRARNTSAASTQKSTTPCLPAGTRVDISAASTQLLALQDVEQVDMARVNTLRAAIAAGELPVDANRIADGLIASARELLK